MLSVRKQIAVATPLVVLLLLLACQPQQRRATLPSNTQPANPMREKPISGPVNYVALGDSTGVGVGARNGGYVSRIFKNIASSRAESKLTNLCVSGATTEDVLLLQLRSGIASSPNLVTVGVGINDIGLGVDLEEFSRDYEEILSQLTKGTQARIVVINIPDISSAPSIPEFARALYRQRMVAFNQRLESIAARYQVTVFDVHAITREHLPAHPEFFSGDGFHPSDAGYELWANEMWPVVARSIGLDSPKRE